MDFQKDKTQGIETTRVSKVPTTEEYQHND